MAAKDIAISKKIKITQAQQNMILAVLGASLVVGVAISLSINFVQQAAFKIEVNTEKEAAAQSYTKVIRDVGICTKPKGSTYTVEEMKACDPSSVDAEQVPGTLRATILGDLAANQALNSVQRTYDADCINTSTGKTYTYSELEKIYNNAEGSSELSAATNLIKSCSALRVIPDALPAYKNEEALLASLNAIFNESGWTPDSLSPNDNNNQEDELAGLETLGVNVSVEADTATVLRVLDNIERSIRTFNFSNASIEWTNANTLSFSAQATAYYTQAVELTETTKTIKVDK